jgi:aminoglycoside 6-adenylyltransferase
MRSEQEMLALILGTAREDERIRAVVMNGSRANPNAPRDPFQDFDVVYYVTDVQPYVRNYEWIERFGELMIMQMPEEMGASRRGEDEPFVYLMQFADGNRIDLTLFPIERLDEMEEDSQSLLLLDKDGLFEELPPASDADYLPEPPTAEAFAHSCNEFWWVSAYVAKGLWREELLYAKGVMDRYVRDQLVKMLAWYVGQRTDFSVSPGKFGKDLRRHLEPELWEMLLDTYSDAGYEANWEALLTAGELFRWVALEVAEHWGFEYPHGDDERVTAHLRHVRALPHDATEMY